MFRFFVDCVVVSDIFCVSSYTHTWTHQRLFKNLIPSASFTMPCAFGLVLSVQSFPTNKRWNNIRLLFFGLISWAHTFSFPFPFPLEFRCCRYLPRLSPSPFRSVIAYFLRVSQKWIVKISISCLLEMCCLSRLISRMNLS